MTVGVTKTRLKGTYVGDLIRTEFHRSYNYVEAPLVNPNGTSAGDLVGFVPLGQPVKASGNNYVFVLATDEASTIGLVAVQTPITLAHGANTAPMRHLILRRGPAIVDQDALPANDVAAGGGSAGTPFTIATIVTALAALSPPIIVVRELTPTKEQTA